MGPGEIIARCEGTVSLVVPRFEETYNVRIRTPEVVLDWADYAHQDTMMMYEDAGNQIRVMGNFTWRGVELECTTCHELGHAALYHNSNFFKEINETLEDHSDSSPEVAARNYIQEGIAQHFEDTGTKILLKDSTKNPSLKTLQYAARIPRNTLLDLLSKTPLPLTSKYARGRKKLALKNPRYVSRVIKNPWPLYHEILGELSETG